MKVSFKTYKFAVKSALYILFSTVCFAAGLYYVQLTFRRLYLFGLIFMLIVYLFSFIVLQYRVERFIYRRKKKSMMMFRFGIKHIHKSALRLIWKH
jgi:two-component system phosphate regulon sensor histidine kinase PhoR